MFQLKVMLHIQVSVQFNSGRDGQQNTIKINYKQTTISESSYFFIHKYVNILANEMFVTLFNPVPETIAF